MLEMIAIVINTIWLGLVIFCFTKDSHMDVELLIVFISLAATAIINNCAILFSHNKASELWPFVFFKRKAMEEKIRIEKLMNENQEAKPKDN